MKILDKYLLREYLYTFAGALFICVIVLLVYMSVENYEDILKNEPGLKYTALFFINSLPFQIIQII
ncbi:MAG TPA: hypothetical protein PLB62_15670, partial [Candidatus Sumerlaeota bacterium]|nr:hypothetical protein [Candidatus Sumerlaeota bacterium]